jgi:hypothetical protein
MSKDGRLIDIGKSLYDVVLHFRNTYTTLYKVLRQEQNEAIDNFEEEKKGRSKEEQDYIDKKINAFKIIRNKELSKHVDLLRDLNDAVSLTNGIYNNAKILEKDKKQTTVTADTIQEKIEQILPMLERIFSNSDFILKRILKHKAYVLKEQDELKKVGLTFDPQEEVLRDQLKNLAAGVKDQESSLGAFKQARGSINTAHGNYFGGRIATIRGGIKTNWSSPTAVKKAEREDKKNDITQHLSSATPDSLSSMSGEMKQKISSYVKGRAPADDQTDVEKLIYEKTGKSKNEILSGGLDSTSVTQPVTGSNSMTKALVPYSPQPKSIAENISGGGSSMTKALTPYVPPANKPSPVSVASALPSMENVLRQQQGLPSSSSIYPDASKLETGTMSTAMVPYHGPNLKQIAAAKKLKAAMENNVIPQTTKKSIPRLTSGDKGFEKRESARRKLKAAMRKSSPNQKAIPLRGDKDFEDKQIAAANTKSFWQSANFGQPGGSGAGGGGGGGISGSSAKKAYNNIMNVRVVEIVPEPLDSLKTIFHSAMAEALDYYSASPKLKVHLESVGNNISQLLSSLFGQGNPTPSGQTTPNTNLTNPGQTTTNQNNSTQSGVNPTNVPSPTDLDPFQKRLKKIYKEGEEEITFLYAKINSFFPFFSTAQAKAKKTALATLKAGYDKFDEVYKNTGSAFKGMMASVNAMFKVSPITVIMAGLTTAFIGILGAATRLNNKIKEISAELGTSNMQSYEFFKNAMNAQTQYDNMYASLRDVRDVQKGILGDSGILLKVNDKALASIADNAKNIGVSTEAAGAFTEVLRTKGATDNQAANLMAASLELADKSKFIMPQSVIEDITQNVEFSSKYFSNINKDSKSAQKHLVDTNLQVKALGLNFQKAAKMTQHLLSFEQSITAEVEASVALGRHVNIGKARELLLQDDIGGAMQQMMDTMGGYEAFQDMDFAKRQLMANAVGLEVSELEKSLYLRDKIGITNEEALNAAMKNSDYLDKVAGKNVELYKVEAKKVLAAEQFNTAVEKVSVAFKSSLLPVLEAILPIVEMMASAINFVAAGVKTIVGFPGKILNGITGHKPNSEVASPTAGLEASMNIGMVTVMGGLILKTLKGKLGGKIGEVIGKARGGLDTLTGTLGTKTNPMYVISLGGGGIGGIMDSVGGGGLTTNAGRPPNLKTKNAGRPPNLKSLSQVPAAKVGAFSKISQYLAKAKIPSIPKMGGALAILGAAGDLWSRKSQGQSNTQAVAGTAGGVAGGLGGALLGAKGGAILGAAIGTAIGGPIIGTAIGAGFGGLVGGISGGLAGSYAGGAIVDSQFNKDKKDSSYQAQPFQYQGMGLSATGSIYGGVNNQKATGKPVQTFMADMLPTGFSAAGSIANNSPTVVKGSPVETFMADYTPSIFGTSMSSKYQGSGVVKNSQKSIIQSNTSKNVENQALISRILERYNENDTEKNKSSDEWAKWLKIIAENSGKPSMAVFTPNNARPFLNYMNSKNTQ